MNILVVLILLMIIGAIVAIETRGLLASIICVGAVGFLLSIAFLFLGAPDVAITQLVVEILCLVILIRATISRDLTSVTGYRDLFGLIVRSGSLLFREFDRLDLGGASLDQQRFDPSENGLDNKAGMGSALNHAARH